MVDCRCHNVGQEKLGLVAGVDIVLQLEEIMILPGRGDIGGKKGGKEKGNGRAKRRMDEEDWS